MNKLLRRIGFVFLACGILFTAMATVAYFSPLEDPTGIGADYDRRVAEYNQQMEELVRQNNLPIPIKGKSRLQMHREDTLFAMVAGGTISTLGCFLIYFNRVGKRLTATGTEAEDAT